MCKEILEGEGIPTYFMQQMIWYRILDMVSARKDGQCPIDDKARIQWNNLKCVDCKLYLKIGNATEKMIELKPNDAATRKAAAVYGPSPGKLCEDVATQVPYIMRPIHGGTSGTPVEFDAAAAADSAIRHVRQKLHTSRYDHITGGGDHGVLALRRGSEGLYVFFENTGWQFDVSDEEGVTAEMIHPDKSGQKAVIASWWRLRAPHNEDRFMCLLRHTKYLELNGKQDMEGQGKETVDSVFLCQQRCKQTDGCAHFSYWSDGGCHLQSATAQPVDDRNSFFPVELAGPADPCPRQTCKEVSQTYRKECARNQILARGLAKLLPDDKLSKIPEDVRGMFRQDGI